MATSSMMMITASSKGWVPPRRTRMERTVRVSHGEWFLAALVPALGLLLAEQMLAAGRLLRIP